MKICRKTHLIASIGMILLTIPVLSASAAAKITLPQAAIGSVYSEDEKALRVQADDYVKAFAAGDYKTIANMWALDGTFTDIDGRVLSGRSAIEAYFKKSFEYFGGQPLAIVIESIKFPNNNVAIEEGHTRLLRGSAIDTINHYMVVHLKIDNKWQMYAVTETNYPEALNGSLQDLDWLIGNWSAQPSPTKSIHVMASWATGHKFIRCLFETDNSITGPQIAMLLIGRDPSNGRIISWHFDPSGGFGSGKWIKDGQTWIERAKSVESDGTTGSALYTLHKLDNDNFTWGSTQRYLGDSQLPDSSEIKISRDAAVSK